MASDGGELVVEVFFNVVVIVGVVLALAGAELVVARSGVGSGERFVEVVARETVGILILQRGTSCSCGEVGAVDPPWCCHGILFFWGTRLFDRSINHNSIST